MLAAAGMLPRDDGWSFEIKYDGARCIAVVSPTAGRVRLFSRRGTDLTASFPEVAVDLLAAAVGCDDLVLDGELVTPDREGRPVFARLHRRLGVGKPSARLLREVPASLYVFDLLVEGEDVRALPYRERRTRLEGLPLKGRHLACPPAWLDADVDTVLAIAEAGGFEGIVAKRSDSRYRSGRSTAWRKLPLRKRIELVVGGWFPRTGSRGDAVGAVLVGAYDNAGAFVFVGTVGTGFTTAERRRLAERLRSLGCSESPFDRVPAEGEHALWVTPDVVGAVEYREFVAGRLRHPSWKGERCHEVSPSEVALDSLT
ncbi:DNA polymerase LigD, ligase domain protein [Mycolicibacterium rhodesiae JS60]|nr:DNA polymerase LigD, ligase domain protein [Mycolicibacterium rhodesiae JS60]